MDKQSLCVCNAVVRISWVVVRKKEADSQYLDTYKEH